MRGCGKLGKDQTPSHLTAPDYMYAYLCNLIYFYVFYKYFAPGQRPQGLFFLKMNVFMCMYVYLCIFMYMLCICMHFTSISLRAGARRVFFLKNDGIYVYLSIFMYF